MPETFGTTLVCRLLWAISSPCKGPYNGPEYSMKVMSLWGIGWGCVNMSGRVFQMRYIWQYKLYVSVSTSTHGSQPLVLLGFQVSSVYFFTRRRSSSFAEYCKHFVARLNDVHEFGYNSAGSERIWMKFGQLRVYGLELSITNFGRDPRRSGFGTASRSFVFLSIK